MERCIYFFVIGAFFGWLLECVYKFVTLNFERTPGILFGPFCILYGVGTVFLSLIVPKITNNVLLQFALSFIVLTALEYITHVILKNAYNIVLWDYSTMPFRFNEKICFEFSAIWGILGVVYIRYIYPVLNNIYTNINKENGILTVVIWSIMIYILVDLAYSSYALLLTKKGASMTFK